MTANSTDASLMLSVSGCRGIFGKSITPEIVARFALVLAARFRQAAGSSALQGRPVLVLGRDGRLGGHVLAQAAAAGLAAGGCDVLDIGIAMTPTVGVMVDQIGAVGGVVVTASHNGQEWNGLKTIIRAGGGAIGAVHAAAPGKAIADEVIARFREACERGIHGVGPGEVGEVRLAPTGASIGMPSEGAFAHVEKVRHALQTIGSVDDRRAMGLSCVVDSVNASGAEGARLLLGRRLRHHLGASDNGIFPHAPEPTRENLTMLGGFVTGKQADAGFAQDPDADRLAIIDEQGTYIGEEYTLVLAAEAVLGSGAVLAGGAVVCTNLSTSRMIEDTAQAHGARVVRTAVGEANVVEAMKQHGSVIGGEGNGGVIWPAVTYIRDSLSAMSLVLALMARTGKSLSALVAERPAYAIVKRKVDLAGTAQAASAVEAISRRYARESVDRQDGARVDFPRERAWLHVRASNTEPIMRLIAEAPTEAVANQILADASAAIGG